MKLCNETRDTVSAVLTVATIIAGLLAFVSLVVFPLASVLGIPTFVLLLIARALHDWKR